MASPSAACRPCPRATGRGIRGDELDVHDFVAARVTLPESLIGSDDIANALDNPRRIEPEIHESRTGHVDSLDAGVSRRMRSRSRPAISAGRFFRAWQESSRDSLSSRRVTARAAAR